MYVPVMCVLIKKIDSSRQIFNKNPQYKLSRQFSSANQVVRADRWTDMTELALCFHSFEHEPKKSAIPYVS
jgi:hypothetical protein